MRKIAVVTTFNASGLHRYAQKMIDTFAQTWPKDVTLYVYAEDCTPVVSANNIVVRDLHQSSQLLVDFKNKWKNVPKANGDISADPVRSRRKDSTKGFKWDAVRFAHKVYSIFHCADNCDDADILFWMDADTICHTPITIERIEELVPDKFDLCYVGRERKWPECGLYCTNLKSKEGRKFLSAFQNVYDNAEQGIFLMEEWHDSFVFEEVRKSMPKLKSLNWGKGLVRGEGHPLINSVWGGYLDHLKGGRKSLGKSKPTDLLRPRQETYWS